MAQGQPVIDTMPGGDDRDKAYQAYLAQKDRDSAYQKYLASQQSSAPPLAPADATGGTLPSSALTPAARRGLPFAGRPERYALTASGDEPLKGPFQSAALPVLSLGASTRAKAAAGALYDATRGIPKDALNSNDRPITGSNAESTPIAFGDAYRQNLGAQKQAEEEYTAEHPWLSRGIKLAAMIPAALATGGGTLMGEASTAAKMWQGAKSGAMIVGGQAAGGAERGHVLTEGLKGTAEGLALGATAPFGLPAVGATVGAMHGAMNPVTGGTDPGIGDRAASALGEGAFGAGAGWLGGKALRLGGRMLGPTIDNAVDKVGGFMGNTVAPAIRGVTPSGASVLEDLMNSTGPRGRMAAEVTARAKLGGVNPTQAADAMDPTIPGFVRGQPFPARANQATAPADVLGQGVQDFQGDIYRRGGAPAIKLGTAVSERAKAAGPIADAELATSAGQSPITNGKQATETLAVLDKSKKDIGKEFEAWRKANPGDLNDPEIDAVRKYPAMQSLLGRVQRSRLNRGESLPTRGGDGMGAPPGIPADQWALTQQAMKARGIPAPQSGGELVPDLEALHLMERTLYKAKRGAFEGASENPMTQQDAIDLEPVVKMLRNKIAPPGSAAYEMFQRYAANRNQSEALQSGLDLFKTKGAADITALEGDVAAMSPAEQAMFRQGATVALRNRIGGKDVPINGFTDAIAAKALPSGENGKRLAQLAFPDEQSWQTALEQASGRRAMAQTRDATLGGSPTIKFGAGQANPFVTGPQGGAAISPGLAYSPRHAAVSMANAVAKKGAQEMSAREAGAATDWLVPKGGFSSTNSADAIRSMTKAAANQANRPSADALAKLTAAIQANQSFNRP